MNDTPSIPATSDPKLELGLPGWTWRDLFDPAKLEELHTIFLSRLATDAPDTAKRFESFRASKGAGMKPQAISEVLVDVAPHVSAFVGKLFAVGEDKQLLADATERTLPIFIMKEQLVKRRAVRRGNVDHDPALDDAGARLLRAAGVKDLDDELQVARFAVELLELIPDSRKAPPPAERVDDLRARVSGVTGDGDVVTASLEILERWLMMRREHLHRRGWMSFRLPHDVDYDNLVQLRRPRSELQEEVVGPEEHRRARDGFRLTDPRATRLEVQDQVEYCLYCHERDKDSCSKGLKDKAGAVKANPLGIPLPGCPLDEKISEMHLMKKHGDSIAALALVCVDNPMLPGTGHRICNDCMKACIFQKQEPVNIPQIETGVLTDVLDLPWGFEIYGLLTRWNPLNVRRPFPLPYHGKNVLVVGLGPAGYTLSHHLVNEGFGVVGVDGLKIEPLEKNLLEKPVKSYRAIYGQLDERVLHGFGGVSEYGITVRWDKNFLKVIYLTLARRKHFKIYGGVRFGGTLQIEDAWALGIDHIAIAAGAGKPTIIDLENNLIRGIRKASDFLMALQLTGAYKKSMLANLQVRLPALVIGGGLTAIDTATELRAYYIVQVEKVLSQFEAIAGEVGEVEARKRFDKEEAGILDELLGHGRAVREERLRAKAEGRAPVFDAMIDSWGGVSIAYRKRLSDSPAYRLNHEEVIKCLEEGVRFIENMNPKAAIPDEYGALRAVTFTRSDGTLVELPARTLCVAAGTSPNTTYEREHKQTFVLDKKGFFLAHKAVAGPNGELCLEADPGGFFTSYLDAYGRTISFYGDNHPKYAGSVVKAMASAKDGFQAITAIYEREIAQALSEKARQAERDLAWERLVWAFNDGVQAMVVAVNRLTPTIVEVVIHAPNQARKFHPGQFYRLQNYESHATEVNGTKLAMEGIALTGAWVDRDRGLLSLIVLEMGVSSRLCAALKPGEPVVVMGPTGAPTEIPKGETILLAGGGLGNAVLFSIAKALRAAGCTVIYFAGYKKPEDVFKQNEIEEGTHQVIWSSDIGPAITPRRPQDLSFVGNIVQAILAYAKGDLGAQIGPLSKVDRIIAIGSDRMMAAVGAARHGVLQPYLKPQHVGIGSINSPMQCMMKEICAQCLQKHVDPRTGKTTVVFSCFNQDQELDHVDWKNLNARLRQNTVQEKLTNAWLDLVLSKRAGIVRV